MTRLLEKVEWVLPNAYQFVKVTTLRECNCSEECSHKYELRFTSPSTDVSTLIHQTFDHDPRVRIVE